MAKMFYTLEEACEKLSMSEDQIKDLVRQAKLREFRDAGKVNYKTEEIDALASVSAPDASAESGSGELVLEPAEESTIDLAMGGSTGDMLSLEEADSDGTAAGEESGDSEENKKNGTVVTSVGISVFDEAEALDGVADPLAQTVVSGASGGGLGIEGVGSGSGLLDLTRESDDTSLGAELLDEIYPADQEDGVEMGDATRAGLEDAISEEAPEGDDIFEGSGVAAPGVGAAEAAAPAPVVTQVVEFAPDAWSVGLTGLMVVVVAVLGFTGLAVAAAVRDVSLPMIEFVYNQKLWMFGAGAVVVGGIATGVGYMLGKRSAG